MTTPAAYVAMHVPAVAALSLAAWLCSIGIGGWPWFLLVGTLMAFMAFCQCQPDDRERKEVKDEGTEQSGGAAGPG